MGGPETDLLLCVVLQVVTTMYVTRLKEGKHCKSSVLKLIIAIVCYKSCVPEHHKKSHYALQW